MYPILFSTKNSIPAIADIAVADTRICCITITSIATKGATND